MNVFYYDFIKDFEKQYKNADLSLIDNGRFLRQYSKLKVDARRTVKEAKKLESVDSERSFDFFQQAYNKFTEIPDIKFLINNSNVNL